MTRDATAAPHPAGRAPADTAQDTVQEAPMDAHAPDARPGVMTPRALIAAIAAAIAAGALIGFLRTGPSGAGVDAGTSGDTGGSVELVATPPAPPSPVAPAAPPQTASPQAAAEPTPSTPPAAPAPTAAAPEATVPAAAPTTVPSASAPPEAVTRVPATSPTTEADVRAVYDALILAGYGLSADPDPARVADVYTQDCPCFEEFLAAVEQLERDGRRFVGPVPTVLEWNVAQRNPDGYVIRVRRQRNGAQELDAAGTVVRDYPQRPPDELFVTIRRDAELWRIANIEYIGQPAAAQ